MRAFHSAFRRTARLFVSTHSVTGPLVCFLAGLRARKHSTFEFPFGLEPIVQVTAWLLAAFEIDFVGATPDILFTRRVPYRRSSGLHRLRGSNLLRCASISLWFR